MPIKGVLSYYVFNRDELRYLLDLKEVKAKHKNAQTTPFVPLCFVRVWVRQKPFISQALQGSHHPNLLQRLYPPIEVRKATQTGLSARVAECNP